MRPIQTRFVSVCQQMLVLGAVFAVLVPAASVISLDVITSAPREVAPGQWEAQSPVLSEQRTAQPVQDDAADATSQAAPVESTPVEPVVEEHPMDTEVPAVAPEQRHHGHDHGAADGADDSSHAEERDADTLRKGAQRRTATDEPTTVVSAPEKVRGYGAVGVTWSPDSSVGDGDIAVEVRTRSNGAWSEWTPVEHHAEHGPDPTTPEGRDARPGTDALIVGEVDEVQARATTEAGVESPEDLRLAVVAPGESEELHDEKPAIDTAKLRQNAAAAGDDETTATLETDQGEIALQAATATKKPKIFSRAQWGANEKLRSGSPSYYEVHAGFVHHTVNSNSYTKAQVPGIIRNIYAYHTRSRGWSDIGYNFLVDKFGRIWEGRAGGVDRPVVGAHTLNYNSYSFAMSAIGNFDIAKPGKKIVNAYGRLMAWKLSLHGVDATSTKQQVGSRSFPAINGHRDAAATACPGRYLYAKLAKIRKKAGKKQSDWTGRELATDLVGSPEPDLLVGKKNGDLLAVPTGGMVGFDRAVVPAGTPAGQQTVVASPDLTGDGRADLVVVAADGSHQTLPGTADGGFKAPIRKARRFAGLDQLTAVGDLNGDGKNDMVGRNAAKKLLFFAGKGNGAFKKRKVLGSWEGYDLTAATGDVTGDGHPDILARDASGKLWLHPGTGRAEIGQRRAVNRNWGSFDVITGYGDVDGDGRADLLLRRASDGRLLLRPGNGKGGFMRSFGPLGNISSFSSVSAAAVSQNAQPALVGLRNGKIGIRAHNGRRNTGEPVLVGSFPNVDLVLNAGDWDRDGHGDIITRNKSGNLRLHRGLGNDRFAAPKRIAKGFGNVTMLAAVGDITGDGHPDLMGQPRGGAMRVYPGTGQGLGGAIVARSAVTGAEQFGIGRWDSDGAPDVFIRNGDTLQWYQGNGPGGLTGSARKVGVNLKGHDLVMSPGDLNGDGRQDLVVRRKGTGALWMLPGKANGFGSRVLLATKFKAYDKAG